MLSDLKYNQQQFSSHLTPKLGEATTQLFTTLTFTSHIALTTFPSPHPLGAPGAARARYPGHIILCDEGREGDDWVCA